MSTPLLAKLFSGAQAYGPLATILAGTPFRFYDTSLIQGSLFPAIVARQVSSPQMYSAAFRMTTNWNRIQFEVWAQPDSAATDQVAQAFFGFIDQFNADGITGRTQSPNFVLNDMGWQESKLEPPAWQRIIDVRIFNSTSSN